MPTFPRLVAAIWFGALGALVAWRVVPLLPEGTQLGWFLQISAAIGVVIGWRFMARRAFDRFQQMVGYGITISLLTLFWGVFVFAGYDIYRRSIRMHFDGPVQAIESLFVTMADYAVLAATPTVMGALLVGGALGGWVIWYFARFTS
ncbi:MAG: TrgA family protein [Paracoccaceae bacterium]